MTYEDLKPGDHVRCTDARDTTLTEGRNYIVSEGGRYTIALEGVPSWQYAHRFERVGPPDLDTARAAMATRLSLIGDDLNALLTAWQRDDLPDDFLTGETYPFTVDLEEQIARVRTAVEALRKDPA